MDEGSSPLMVESEYVPTAAFLRAEFSVLLSQKVYSVNARFRSSFPGLYSLYFGMGVIFLWVDSSSLDT
jgi:hypothetical protein